MNTHVTPAFTINFHSYGYDELMELYVFEQSHAITVELPLISVPKYARLPLCVTHPFILNAIALSATIHSPLYFRAM